MIAKKSGLGDNQTTNVLSLPPIVPTVIARCNPKGAAHDR